LGEVRRITLLGGWVNREARAGMIWSVFVQAGRGFDLRSENERMGTYRERGEPVVQPAVPA
jgi:hypothetical protein